MPASRLLIPVKKCVRERGAFRWPAGAVLAGPGRADLLPLGQLAGDLGRQLRIRTRIERSVFGPAAVRIRRDSKIRGREAYWMRICPEGVEILASGDPGAYYAVQTVRELLRAHGRSIPACVIDDRPDFARRGVYHDCSRGKVPKLATLKDLVERLAHWKVNELQLYVEDVFTFARHPAIGAGHSPFTPGDILAVQDHCKRHHVRLVGSLASFGHMERILSLPAYSHLGEMPGFRGLPGGRTLCPGDPGSIRLVAELYEEFVPLHEAEDFNVCCDETWELGRGRSKRRAERVGVGRVYLGFLLKLYRLCQKHGKRMNAWADIVLQHPELLGELPTDVVMLNWAYHPAGPRIPRTREITDAGLAAVVCPGTNAWNSHGCRLQMGARNIAAFAAEGLRRGAEGLLNTDWGDGGHRNMLAVSLHNLACGAAHSWNHRGTRDEGFTERFCLNAFGARGASVPGAIRTLGRAQEVLRAPYGNYTPFYGTWVDTSAADRSDESNLARRVGQHLDRARSADLAEHARALAGLHWPSPREAPDAFTARTFAEYALAARMDMVACKQAGVLKQVRAGESPAAAEVKGLVALANEVLGEFQRVWRLGNRPSRLRDNVRRMRKAIRAYQAMAR